MLPVLLVELVLVERVEELVPELLVEVLVPLLRVAELLLVFLVAVELELPLRTVDCWPVDVVVLVLVLLLPDDCTRLEVVDELDLVAALLPDVAVEPVPRVADEPELVLLPRVALEPEVLAEPLVALDPDVPDVPRVELVLPDVPLVALVPLEAEVPLVADELLPVEDPRVAEVVVVLVASYAILTSYALAWVLVAFSAR